MKKEFFIEKALAVHGNCFDYSLLPDEFLSKLKVPVICKKHGQFLITSGNHISNGRGCPACYSDRRKTLHNMSKEDFAVRIKDLHPNLTVDVDSYERSHSYIKVFCKFHGESNKQARHLLAGHGCVKCGYDLLRKERAKNETYYIDKFIEVHGTCYDYTNSRFESSKQKFDVICKEHGLFKTTVSNHLKGKGCPLCGHWKSGFRGNKSGTFYILKVTDSVYKFGISNKFEDRFKILQSRCNFILETMYRFDFKNGQIARDIEAEIIASNIDRGVVNNLDMPSGYTETFYIKDISFILNVVDKYINLEE